MRERAHIRGMAGYVPGLQPKAGAIKLNTNGNPFPPSPAVMTRLADVSPLTLQRYPDPLANGLRRVVARLHCLALDQVVATNGGDELLRLVRAIARTQKWLQVQDATDIAAVIREFFPATPPARLASALDRYKRLGIWGRDPYLPRGGYDRLRSACLSGGIVRRAPTWEQAVDMRLATRVIAENLLPLQ